MMTYVKRITKIEDSMLDDSWKMNHRFEFRNWLGTNLLTKTKLYIFSQNKIWWNKHKSNNISMHPKFALPQSYEIVQIK